MELTTKRRILICVENLPVPLDRRVWLEAVTLVSAGYQVSVICPASRGWDAPYEEIEGVHIYRYPEPPEARLGALAFAHEWGASLWHMFRLARRVRRERGFDVIQGCNPPDLMFLVAWPFKALHRTRYIFDHHDICPELYEAKFGRRGFCWRLMVLFERLNFLTADVVISTNESYRKIAMERGGKQSSDVFVVRSGPDLKRLKVKRPSDLWRNGRDEMIGYVGVMGDQEGLDLLLEAARDMVHERKRDVQFVLVGGGPALSDLQRQAEEMQLTDHVTFTGPASDDDLFAVLSSADVCVNPDRVNPMNDKSTMNKIMEYMAFSKPIVQFDVTEGRFSAAGSSLYARANDTKDLADKIVELLDDPARRAEMGRIGRARVESKLSWRRQVGALLAAYDHAFRKGYRPPARREDAVQGIRPSTSSSAAP